MLEPHQDENQRLRRLASDLENDVAKRTRDLQLAVQELESFTYSVAHDLRAPLRSINSFSRALMEDYGERFAGEPMDYFERICRASERMGRLIDDLLRLSQVGRRTLEIASVDLSALVGDSLARLAELDPTRAHRFTVEPGLLVPGDGRLLTIAIDNLTENAWKFSRRRPTTEIRFWASGGHGDRTFHLADNGTGFDMRYSHKLFAPFQRLHHADDFEGTGIGLVTVSRIITRHRGTVGIEAVPDRGAVVSFTIPTASPEPAPW
jgi:light-regulated signal transduction histidine kinase (bacteriophytochrome)